jgi:hypothetical protein
MVVVVCCHFDSYRQAIVELLLVTFQLAGGKVPKSKGSSQVRDWKVKYLFISCSLGYLENPSTVADTQVSVEIKRHSELVCYHSSHHLESFGMGDPLVLFLVLWQLLLHEEVVGGGLFAASFCIFGLVSRLTTK